MGRRLTVAWALVAASFAQDDVEAQEGVEEVVVYGEAQVRAARERLVRACKAAGWSVARRTDDAIVFRPPEQWMGRAWLYRDGRFAFGRPVLAYAGGGTPDHVYDADAVLDRNTSTGLSVEARTVVLPSKRRTDAVHLGLLEAVDAEIEAYRQTLQETAYRAARDAVAARLDQVWLEGVPLSGEGHLETAAERRQEVLAYWASRASTPEGDGISRAIEVWLEAVVQTSDTPLTRDEIAAAHALRPDGRVLPLTGTPPDAP